MKKLAAIAIVLLFTSTASAQVIINPTTNARMDAMGVENWQIEDDFNIWINPAQINNYKNSVYVELGHDNCDELADSSSITGGPGCGSGLSSTGHNERNDGAFGGAHIDAGYGTWAFYLGRPYSGVLNSLEDNGSGTAPDANRFDLIYGAQNIPFAIYVGYADRADDTTTGTVKDKDEAGEYNVGVGGFFGSVEAALNIGLPSGKCADNSGGLSCGGMKEDASPNISLLARHKHAMANGALLTTAKVITADHSVKGGGTKTDADLFEWHISTAVNSMPNPDTLIVMGIGLENSDSEAKVKPTGGKLSEEVWRVPLNVGLEHHTFKIIKTRFGISKPLYETIETKDTISAPSLKTDHLSDGEATVSFGLGVHAGEGLEIDFVVNQDVLFTGSYFVSGIPESLNSAISVTYRFK